MNKDNLRRMAEYIANVPQEYFDMKDYRDWDGDKYKKKCNSIGCVIGHCTKLDTRPLPRHNNNVIKFSKWSEDFTGLLEESYEWMWCFHWWWIKSDNTPIGASKRILWLIENGLPENWENQMGGREPLCYMQNDNSNEPN